MQSMRALSKSTHDTAEEMVKLSTGERINKAADDAAGLAISEKLKSTIRSNAQANRNASDGISLVQTAEGGLNETSSILLRMRELAIQSSSDTIAPAERLLTNMEYEQLRLEIDRISQSTEFNGKKLLDGSASQMEFQVGTEAVAPENRVEFRPNQLDAGSRALGISPNAISTKESARLSLAKIDNAINQLAGQRTILGSLQNKLQASSANLSHHGENLSAANSRIRDTDYAESTANLSRNMITESAGVSVMAQANTSNDNALKLIR